MPDQVPHETKIERMERLVELTQRLARERNAARVGRVEEVLVEGPSRTDDVAAPRPHAPQHDGQLRRRRSPGRARRRCGSSARPRRRSAARKQALVAGLTSPGRRPARRALRPDGVGQERRRRGAARPARRGGRLGRLRGGVPRPAVLTAAPDHPARLVGICPARPRGLGRRVPAARARSDRRDPRRGPHAGRRRRHRPLLPRRALDARVPAAARARRPRAVGRDVRRARRRGSARAARARATPTPQRASTRTTAAASSARSSSTRPGSSLAPATTALGRPSCATRRCRLAGRRPGRARAPHPRRTHAMLAARRPRRGGRGWARPLSTTARKVLGLEQFATLPLDEAVPAVSPPRCRLARYQRKWIRRFPGALRSRPTAHRGARR